MKKKLEDTYLPEHKGQKDKVLIGLSGGIDSFVSAYLLKIQKFDLFAVTIVLDWSQGQIHDSQLISCGISEQKLTQIKDFCHQLSIPHLVVRPQEEFQEYVVENWMASKLTGTRPTPCWSCHQMRMRILFQKMQEVGATKLATGHFAKIFHNEAHNTVYVHTSNDESHDQSGLLSRLPHDILTSLILPLSDLQKKEVLKLAENFGLSSQEKTLLIHECFDVDAASLSYIEQKASSRFIRGGEITNSERSAKFGEHKGVHHYLYGQEIDLGRQFEGAVVTGFSMKDKSIEVGKVEDLIKDRIMLMQCELSEETSWIEPMKGVIKLSDQVWMDCWIHPKSLRSAYVTWEGGQRVFERDILAVYKKRGKNAKIFFTGKVKYVPNLPMKVEEGDRVENADKSIDM